MENIPWLFRQFLRENGCNKGTGDKFRMAGFKDGKPFCLIEDRLHDEQKIIIKFVDHSKSDYIDSDSTESDYNIHVKFKDEKYIIKHKNSGEVKEFDSFIDVLRYTKEYVYRDKK